MKTTLKTLAILAWMVMFRVQPGSRTKAIRDLMDLARQERK
jgi:hypothetical protein